MDPDRLTELEIERQFLLRSLADLEREHEVGDVDDHDYATLRDGYTARAAAIMRQIDRSARPPERSRTRWGRSIGWVAVVVLIAAGAGTLLARSFGERTANDASQTGGFGDDGTASNLLSQARGMMGNDPVGAIDLFARVLQIEPDNVEAMTYGAWLSAASALGSDNADFIASTARPALQQFDKAIELDPSYPDPQCFSAIVSYLALNDPDAAQPHLDACLAANPPQEAKALVEALADRIASDQAAQADPTLPATDDTTSPTSAP